VRVVVLVPRRADNGRRDEIWAWVKARWQTEHPDWPVVEGFHKSGPFNRSAAINTAARNRKVGSWDIGIIADADSFVSKDQIELAVEKAGATGQMTLAYDRYCYLSRAMSDAVMAGFTGNWWAGVEWTMPGTCSSMVVVTRALWTDTGGFDERFESWGGEDVAFSHAAQTFGGGLKRITGDVWHLWHAPAVHDNNEANMPLMERYGQASYNVEQMRALLDERKAKP
jgi:hypothetical protein